jgi:hypothetical protein
MKIEPGQSVEVEQMYEDCSDNEIVVNEGKNMDKSDDENSTEDEMIIGSDWNGSDEDDNEPKQSTNEIERNGKILKGVFKITTKLKAGLKVNDWIVGDFTNSTESKQCSSKTILFIGTILKLEKTKVEVSFLKYRPTKLDSGIMFVFPEHEDKYWIDKNDIVGILKHPELKRRGLMKFGIDYNEW